jgi:OOP family OmpA-OmpF porin
MRHRALHILLALLGFTALRAQVNLVPNYSFEVLDTCPTAVGNFNGYVQFWAQPSIGSSDIYNTCATIPSGRNVPLSALGFQYAQQGEGYSGVFLFVPSIPDYREYIAVRLVDTLKAGVNYCIKFYVSLSEQYPKSISSIGMHFSPDSIYQDDWDVLQVTPQFENFNGNFINDTTSWQLIKGNYMASGGEKYIYIGNFRNDANTVVDINSVGSRTYVYIDNVQVYECDSLIGIEENPFEKTKIYPNPAQDFVSIDLPKNISQAQLSIYNLTGQLVLQKQIIQPNQTIPITELGNGIYIFVVESEDRVVGRERVVVLK